MQPILGAIDSTAAQSDGYSPRCSCTMRTARSRDSGENLFDLFMAPSSQKLEPPQNPGRFTLDTIQFNLHHGSSASSAQIDGSLRMSAKQLVHSVCAESRFLLVTSCLQSVAELVICYVDAARQRLIIDYSLPNRSVISKKPYEISHSNSSCPL
ncbi:hypothetical protein PAMC26577_19580 [Caballeronia sordidicola]|uniref:Uncharacterized protein n=1 Tax=Caballeronia sordidicola TaxID=196367 RepID=A0A242MNF9_CABSO|nr:hypothetical protein PAMC26577_19580 [Caballeronia sordidicola]